MTSLLFASLACMSDITHNTTSFWAAIKYPKGFKYSYFEPEYSMKPSLYDLQDTDRGAITWTLEQLWNPSQQISYIIYNDEAVDNSTYDYSKGHTKGILATDGDQGFWLQHSTPKFPVGPLYAPSYQGITSNAFDYGQHFFCVTLSESEINRLAGHLMLNHPNIQDYYVTSDAGANFSALARGEYSTTPICESILLETKPSMTVFAKTSQWNSELYADCIGPEFKQQLKVESWIRGSACGAYCGDPEVLDVHSVQFNDHSWSEYNDHSKWAVSNSHICFSDINRMTTQASRGGGAVCLEDSQLVQIFEEAINGTDNC